MSWRSYEILSIQPDFTDAPMHGLGDTGQTMVEYAQAEAWGIWHGDTSLAYGFSWRYDSPAEQRALRDFMNRVRGRSTPFFLPSWQPDFTLAAATTIGDTTIRILDAGLVDVTENRPDTEGRHLFLVGVNGEFQAVAVTSVESDGTDEVLSLDVPIQYAFDPLLTIVGKLQMVRLADDRIEFVNNLPGHGNVALRMVTSRQTRHVGNNETVDGDEVFGLHAFDTLNATDADPVMTEFLHPVSFGPASWGASDENFQILWNGAFDGLDFVITNGIDEPIVSAIFDGSSIPSHVTFGFDASGREFVAWSTGEGNVRMGFYIGSVATWREFPGISPVGFNTYEIDSTATAGESDAVLFYIREGYSGIFARFYREDFATERLVVRSKSAPIYLQRVQSNLSRIEILAMDSGHRRCVFSAGGYVPPLEIQFISGIIRDVTGEYKSVRIPLVSDDASAGQLIAPTGTYQLVRVESLGHDLGAGAGHVEPITGDYHLIRILSPVTEPGASGLVVTPTGTYTLVRKLASTDGAAAGSIQPLTGSYHV